MNCWRVRFVSVMFVCIAFPSGSASTAAQSGTQQPASERKWSKLVTIREIAPKRVVAGAPTAVTITAGLRVPYPSLEVMLVRLTPAGERSTEVRMEHIGDRGDARDRELLYRARVTVNEPSAGKAKFQIVWSAKTRDVPVGESARPFDIPVDPPARP